MKTLISLTLTLLAVNCMFAQANVQHMWKVTLKVVDKNNNPIAGAKASVSYYENAAPTSIDGLTDTNGIFVAAHSVGKSLAGYQLGFAAEKDGYYSTLAQRFLPPTYDPVKWNPTIILTLKKVGKPIPMYAKSVNLGMPVFEKPVGYDLMAGDWVAPYGKGVHTDIIFMGHFDKKTNGESDYTLTVSFPNVGDGIQEFSAPVLLQDAVAGQSDLRSSQNAPADGYQPTFVQTNRDPNRNFYFRVHTVLDENGNVKSTLYGKIYGDFMQFSYYLNPTPNDRNIEYDPGHDLLGGVPSFEQVRVP